MEDQAYILELADDSVVEDAVTRSSRFDPKRRLSFVHFPKSAGTSLTKALAVAIREEHYRAGWDLSSFGGFKNFDTIDPCLLEYIWLSPDKVQQTSLVAGHVTTQTFLGADRNTQLLTILREPMSRVLSLWVFWRRGPDVREPWGDFADRIWISRKPLAEFLNDPLGAFATDNAIARQLLYPHPLIPAGDGFIEADNYDTLYRDAVRCLDKYDFVDFVENAQWLHNLSSWLREPVIVGRENVTDYVEPPFRSSLHEELTLSALTLMLQRNCIDARIWAYIAGRHMTEVQLETLRWATFTNTIARHAISMEP